MSLFDQDALDSLAFAKDLRIRLLNTVIGDKLPDESELDRANFIRNTIKDIEKTVLDVARVKVANKANEASNHNSAILVELIKQTRQTKMNRPIPERDSELVLPDGFEQELVDGEDVIEFEPISYSTLTGSL